MRELRFRAWDLHRKNWVNLQDFYFFSNGEIDYNNSRIAIQQFTGLKDKRGIDIYEGDILNWESNSMSHRLGECKRTRIVVVKWDEKSASFIVEEINRVGLIPVWKMNANDFNGKPFIKEVIGNIFDNKDLLN